MGENNRQLGQAMEMKAATGELKKEVTPSSPAQNQFVFDRPRQARKAKGS